MNFPQIRIQSTYAKIEINTQKGKLEIEQPSADLSIEQPTAEMLLERTPSRLTIDQTKAREDVDLKSIAKRIEEAAQKGHQDLLEGIARRTREGEQLMKIENGGNPIADIAKQHNIVSKHEFGIGWIPSAGSVQINYDPGKLNINWKLKKPIIESKENKPIINYNPGKVEINMEQYPTLKIDFDNLKFIGINYEQSI